jgi:hypothetical protein
MDRLVALAAYSGTDAARVPADDSAPRFRISTAVLCRVFAAKRSNNAR